MGQREFLRQKAAKDEIDTNSNIRSNLSDGIKYCYQIPFEISSESCTVVDLRTPSEVINQLKRFILSGDADDWVENKHSHGDGEL